MNIDQYKRSVWKKVDMEVDHVDYLLHELEIIEGHRDGLKVEFVAERIRFRLEIFNRERARYVAQTKCS